MGSGLISCPICFAIPPELVVKAMIEQGQHLVCNNHEPPGVIALGVLKNRRPEYLPPEPEPEPQPEAAPQQKDLRAEADRWIAENPQVYQLFQWFANQMLEQKRRFGIGQLAERVRWECGLRGRPDEEYKVNNNYRAYIARRLVADNPELESYLRFRKVKF